MYSVTSSVKTAILNGQPLDVEMMVNRSDGETFTIGSDKIVENTFSIDRKASSDGRILFGAAVSNQLKFKLKNENGEYTPSIFQDATIQVNFYVYINGVKTFACEGGKYYVVSCPNFRRVMLITAYGCLVCADVLCDQKGIFTPSIRFSQIISSLATTSALIIDTSRITTYLPTLQVLNFKYPDGDDVTCRYMLGWIAALTGSIVREHGNTDSVQFVRSEATGITINSTNRFEGGAYDEPIELTGITIYDAANVKYQAGTDGYRMEIASNGIFDQLYDITIGGTSYKSTLTSFIWSKLNGFSYTPCTFKTLPMPFLECGDQISFVDDWGNTKTTVLSQVHITLKETTISASGRSETMNDLVGSLPSSILRDSITNEMICTDALKSTNYSADDTIDADFSQGGTFFDLANGKIRSKNFVIKENGDAKFKGNIQATSGNFGGLTIVDDGLSYDDAGSHMLVNPAGMYLINGDFFFANYEPMGITITDATLVPFQDLFIGMSDVGGTYKPVIDEHFYLSDDHTNLLKDRFLKYNGQPVRKVVAGSNIYFNYNNGTLTINANQTCFAEGTKIRMADGTDKNIEDIKVGDVVMSYDPATQKSVDAVVLYSVCTGTEQNYEGFIFEDGSTLEIFDKHSIWNEDSLFILNSKSFGIGQSARMVDNTVNKLITKMSVRHSIPKKHYNIVSSNNLHYANGVLCGHDDADKYTAMIGMGIPEEIMNRWKTYGETYDKFFNSRINPEFVKKGADILKQINFAKKEINSFKNELSNGDHEDNKALEIIVSNFKKMATGSFISFIKGFKDLVSELASYSFERRDELRTLIKSKQAAIDELWESHEKVAKESVGEAPNLAFLFRDSVTESNKDFETLVEWTKTLKKE